LFVVTKCYSYSKIVLQLTVVPPAEYPMVTVTFRELSFFVVTKCYSYSKIVLQLTVVPPGEYPIVTETSWSAIIVRSYALLWLQ
jgi:hypothetical protein